METLEFLKLYDEGHIFLKHELEEVIKKSPSVYEKEEKPEKSLIPLLIFFMVDDRYFILKYFKTEKIFNAYIEYYEQPIEVVVTDSERIIKQQITSYKSFKDGKIIYQEVIKEDVI